MKAKTLYNVYDWIWTIHDFKIKNVRIDNIMIHAENKNGGYSVEYELHVDKYTKMWVLEDNLKLVSARNLLDLKKVLNKTINNINLTNK